MPDLLISIENSYVGLIARESLFGFPVLVAVHLLGLMLSVGILLWVDLRMIGMFLTNVRLSVVYRTLLPWLVGGFCIMFGSGAALFAGFASSAYANDFFRIKIAAMSIAGINALIFHLTSRGLPEAADSASTPPRRIRAAGAVSLALWIGVILCGRMMSYTLF